MYAVSREGSSRKHPNKQRKSAQIGTLVCGRQQGYCTIPLGRGKNQISDYLKQKNGYLYRRDRDRKQVAAGQDRRGVGGDGRQSEFSDLSRPGGEFRGGGKFRAGKFSDRGADYFLRGVPGHPGRAGG